MNSYIFKINIFKDGLYIRITQEQHGFNRNRVRVLGGGYVSHIIQLTPQQQSAERRNSASAEALAVARRFLAPSIPQVGCQVCRA